MRAPRYRSAHIFIVKPYVIDVKIKKAVIWMIDPPLILYDRADTMASPLQMARIVLRGFGPVISHTLRRGSTGPSQHTTQPTSHHACSAHGDVASPVL